MHGSKAKTIVFRKKAKAGRRVERRQETKLLMEMRMYRF